LCKAHLLHVGEWWTCILVLGHHCTTRSRIRQYSHCSCSIHCWLVHWQTVLHSQWGNLAVALTLSQHTSSPLQHTVTNDTPTSALDLSGCFRRARSACHLSPHRRSRSQYRSVQSVMPIDSLPNQRPLLWPVTHVHSVYPHTNAHPALLLLVVCDAVLTSNDVHQHAVCTQSLL
jgi:hypothetical protein